MFGTSTVCYQSPLIPFPPSFPTSVPVTLLLLVIAEGEAYQRYTSLMGLEWVLQYCKEGSGDILQCPEDLELVE